MCRSSLPKRPDESGRFPRHGDGGDPFRFSSSDQFHELPVEAQFGLPGGFDHLGWLPLAPDEDGLGCSRGEPLVMPRRFDQDAADMAFPVFVMLCVSRATSPTLLTIFFEMRRQRGARDCRRYGFDRLLASWRRKDAEGSIYFRTRLEMGGAPIVEKGI